MTDTEESITKLTFPAKFTETVRRHGNRNAFAFVGEEPKTYKQAYSDIKAVMALLEKNGIKKGDKVAILSTNMPNWGITYFAITFMGAVAVPILPDFSITEVRNVLDHSECKAARRRNPTSCCRCCIGSSLSCL